MQIYHSVYYLLREYLPIVLHRPFLFSSIYPMVLGPVFAILERVYRNYFVERSGVNKQFDGETRYHIFTFVCLCLCSLIDPLTFSISLRELPNDPPEFHLFLVYSVGLIVFYDVALSLLHILFHYNKWLYAHVHYVHHLDTDPNVVSTTKLHILEVLMVFLTIYGLPVRFFNPHPYCLVTAFMATSVMSILAHSGIKGWYLAEYHRLHHKDPRYNLWNPILSYIDSNANTNF